MAIFNPDFYSKMFVVRTVCCSFCSHNVNSSWTVHLYFFNAQWKDPFVFLSNLTHTLPFICHKFSIISSLWLASSQKSEFWEERLFRNSELIQYQLYWHWEMNFLKPIWQGGVRVPLLVTSTRREVKPVKTILNHVIDWFPTILELAGIKDSDSVMNFDLLFSCNFSELTDPLIQADSNRHWWCVIGSYYSQPKNVGWRAANPWSSHHRCFPSFPKTRFHWLPFLIVDVMLFI